MMRERILLADDHALTLAGMRAVLEPHYEIVGTVMDGRALVDAALRLLPQVIVVDIGMPLLNGIDASVQIKKHLPAVKLLFVTMHDSPAYVVSALQAGASGYVLKSAASEELLGAIESALNGRVYVSSKLSNGSLERFQDSSRVATTLHLSLRERETLQLISEGRTEKEIAFQLHISIKTVGFHRENLKRKLGLRTTAELTRYAVEQRLI
jgi:DNA-binding NarL/FixJ family response regulator